MSKQCSDCKIVLANTSFSKDKTKKDGLRSNCKTCKLKVDYKWKLNNYAAWFKQHRSCQNKNRRKYQLKNLYNLTPEQHAAMLTEREHKCDICQNVMSKPHVDHCHITNKVRGMLCIGCNTALGKFKDDVNMLQRAIDYLNKHK